MNAESKLVFDDVIVGESPVYTGSLSSEVLQACDQLAIHAIVDRVNGIGGLLTVRIEHSADGSQDLPSPTRRGSRWQPKHATPEILRRPFAGNALTNIFGGERKARPSHPFVRLRIQLEVDEKMMFGAVAGRRPISARLALHVAGRVRTTRVDAPDETEEALESQRRAVTELQSLMQSAAGLGREEQRAHVMQNASDETLAHLRSAAHGVRSLDRAQAARLKRLAKSVLAALDDSPCHCADKVTGDE